MIKRRYCNCENKMQNNEKSILNDFTLLPRKMTALISDRMCPYSNKGACALMVTKIN